MNKVMPIMVVAIAVLLTSSTCVHAEDMLRETGKVITKSIGVVADHAGAAVHTTGQMAGGAGATTVGAAKTVVAETGHVMAHPVASVDSGIHAVGAMSKGAVSTTVGATKTVMTETGKASVNAAKKVTNFATRKE